MIDAPPAGGERLDVSCFIPAFDEAQRIETAVQTVDAQLAAAGGRYEIVVVDDASRDDTVARVRRSGSPHVRVVENARGPSFRENLGRAMLQARGEVVLFIDADLSPDPAALREVIECVRSGWDAAVGSRYVAGAVATRTTSRRVASVLYNGALRVLFGSPFRDHQCGLKAFRRDALRAVLAPMQAQDPRGRAWFWDAELLIRSARAGFRVAELPIRWTYRSGGHFMPTRQLRMLPAMLRLLGDVWWRERRRPAPRGQSR